MIHLCALAVITGRGRNVVPPSVGTLDDDEEDFLQRHVDNLRGVALKADSPRGRFRHGSTLPRDFKAALTDDRTEFGDVAARLVNSLAASMLGATNALDCVVALVTDGSPSRPEHVSLLKLDAEIEAAQLEQVRDGVRLKVFRDLLPRPGLLQKGISWPDPRTPHSGIIIKDRNRGTALYFQNAFLIDASPTALETERALIDALADELPIGDVADALALVGDGGPADEVVARVQEHYPNFHPEARELGAGGALAGRIRPRDVKVQKKKFYADGIDLSVPLDRLHQVITDDRGGSFETRISTSTPLTPVDRTMLSSNSPSADL